MILLQWNIYNRESTFSNANINKHISWGFFLNKIIIQNVEDLYLCNSG